MIFAASKIDVTDVTELQNYLAENTEFDETQKKVADTNHDGKTDISDATQIQKYVAEIIPEL